MNEEEGEREVHLDTRVENDVLELGVMLLDARSVLLNIYRERNLRGFCY